jgi:hypothetical protein
MRKTVFTIKFKIAAAIAAIIGIAIPAIIVFQKPSSLPNKGQNPEAPRTPIVATTGIGDDTIIPKPADAKEARRFSAEFAEKAITSMDDLLEKGQPISESTYAHWSHRLFESKAVPSLPPLEWRTLRVEYLERMEESYKRVIKLQKSGKASDLDVLEAGYRLSEAYLYAYRAESLLPTAHLGFDLAIDTRGVRDPNSSRRLPLAFKQTPDDEKRNEALRARLDLPVSVCFPVATPFEDFLRYLGGATVDKAAGFPLGIPIYLDPHGLEAADVSVTSMIVINFEEIPLRTTLRLVLRQLRLDYRVTGGVVLISDEVSIAKAEPKDK